jgi:hypothetical protein
MADPKTQPGMKVFVAPRQSSSPITWVIAAAIFGAVLGWLFLPVKHTGQPAPSVSVAQTPPTVPSESPKVEANPKAVEPPKPLVLINALFDRDESGFEFVPDSFRSTKQLKYVEAIRVDAGLNGGSLKIRLGGKDSMTVTGMSGGWRRSFTLETATELALSFNYELIQSSEYEADELSQALLMLDGKFLGVGGNEFLAQFIGDGNGGNNPTTGPQNHSVKLGRLEAGTHSLVIGAYNNKKTAANEWIEMLIDDVRLQTYVKGAPSTKIKVPAADPISPPPQRKTVGEENVF